MKNERICKILEGLSVISKELEQEILTIGVSHPDSQELECLKRDVKKIKSEIIKLSD